MKCFVVTRLIFDYNHFDENSCLLFFMGCVRPSVHQTKQRTTNKYHFTVEKLSLKLVLIIKSSKWFFGPSFRPRCTCLFVCVVTLTGQNKNMKENMTRTVNLNYFPIVLSTLSNNVIKFKRAKNRNIKHNNKSIVVMIRDVLRSSPLISKFFRKSFPNSQQVWCRWRVCFVFMCEINPRRMSGAFFYNITIQD